MGVRAYPIGANWSLTNEGIYAPSATLIKPLFGIDSYTTLMLHCDGDDGSTTFTDSSASANAITKNGNAQLDTAQKKYGTTSALFDGAGDYLSATGAGWDFGSGVFTLDMWVYVNSAAARTAYMSTLQSVPASRLGWSIHCGTGYLGFRYYKAGNVNVEVARTDDTMTGGWHHLAIVKRGTGATDLGIAVNGVFEWVATGNFTIASSETLVIGREFADFDNYYLNGWLDEIRVSKGIARWTADFTPHSEAYS